MGKKVEKDLKIFFDGVDGGRGSFWSCGCVIFCGRYFRSLEGESLYSNSIKEKS